ncbi:fungal-specific transcription factor domain-containing protein [Multifurca ochricompacta]|uniref:Fungal-specific transcription factor domain-containing protein n=1 Tax=Multifurca ochricompacta TaxID=376703 RepID=A0AAD4MDE6_9AGAM|nr:fungal-specific transcription factor domain-containing protein [Multifurca ochricompacta]
MSLVLEPEISDDEQLPIEVSNRKRSSRACDQCRKTKSKCERFKSDDEPCKSCLAAGTACTFLGPSFKRGPPKGYIHAIEQRWHQVESVLGAILASTDPNVQVLINNLRKDDLARDILSRVDSGPFGPTGRLNLSAAMTKEDFFASIMNNDAQHPRDPSRPKRQSRMSREIVSSNNSMLVTPTLEWQDHLSSCYALTDKPKTVAASSPFVSSLNASGQPSPQRRRLDKVSATSPDWERLYKLDPASESDDTDDAASMVGELSLDENKEVRYHGLISGLHLLSQADRTDERRVGGVWNLPMARVWPPAVNQFIPEENVDVTMPPLDVQRHLLDLYFVYVHPVFPVIHKSLFWKDYEVTHSFLGSSLRERPHISNLLLLSMFAIAARYDQAGAPPPDSGNLWEAGLDHMVQAREVLNRVYHYSRGTTCQALLLLGMREFGIGQMEHGWLYTGMAFRMAQDLGLHRDAANWQMNGRNMFSTQELQARKQIWWACNRADKYTAIYMGRPPSISEWHFDAPPPEVEAEELWAPHSSDPASIDFKPVPDRLMITFRRMTKLCIIIGNVINRIYPVHPPSHSVKRSALAELEAQLDQWYAELPDSLAFDPASSRSIPPPNVMLMHATYWNTVLLLNRCFIPKWRPTHSRHTSNGTRESDALALKSFDVCQSAALHITSLFVAYRSQFGLSRGALLVTQHLFSAGVMHVVTLTMRPSNVQASVALQQTLSCLKEMGVIWPSAFRAWELLDGAKVHVDSGLLISKSMQRHKRPADDAFGTDTEDKNGAGPLTQAFDLGSSVGVDVTAQQVSTAENRLLAHMLGIEIPGVEPSTSYLPRYEWWPRDQTKPTTPDSSQAVSPSPRSGSNHSSPASTMPIPFSFDQTRNFWDAPLLQDMGANFVSGASTIW